MALHTLRRRFAALGTVLGLGVALPFAVGVTPAYAQPQLTITKTHSGDFPRGGQGIFSITVSNLGDEPTINERTRMTDVFPAGITLSSVSFGPNTTGAGIVCRLSPNVRIECETDDRIAAGGSYTVNVTVNVAENAPCTVTNTATVIDVAGDASDSASDTVNIPGPDCNGGNGGNGGNGTGGNGTSILPISLSGLIPIYNNINTNNNINSPGASNTNSQNFRVNAP
ncbi:hypothetical protein ACIPUC_00545 [Streptomyces sp. LARHCF249]